MNYQRRVAFDAWAFANYDIYSKVECWEAACEWQAAQQSACLPLTDEQCDAIYLALDAWAVKVDKNELGLPWIDVGRDEVARDIIRRAVLINSTKSNEVKS